MLAEIKKHKRKLFIVGLIILILAACKFSLVFSVCHAFINLFAGGRSSSKTWLFLIYFLLLLVIPYSIGKRKFPVWKKSGTILLSLIGIGFVLNLSSFLLFIQRYGLTLRDWVMVFFNDEISSTSLLHNHVLKGSIGIILQRFGITSAENLDAGFVFTGLLPQWIYWIGLLLIMLILLFTVTYFISCYAQIQSNNTLAGVALYAILSFSLIKNLIDGGLLNHETIISLAFFAYIIFPSRKTKISVWLSAILYFATLVVFYFLNLYDPSESVVISLLQSAMPFLALTLIYASLCYRQTHGRWGREGILLFILTSLVVTQAMMRDLGTLYYRSVKIDAAHPAIIGLYQAVSDPEFKSQDHIGDLSFYEFTPNSTTTAGAVIDHLQLLDNLYPMAFPYQSCFPHGREDVYAFTLMTNREVNVADWHSTLVRFQKFDFAKEYQGEYFYTVELALKPCLPRPVNIIQEVWKELELPVVFVINIRQASSL